jgi:GNAT superfamily N-acetyltransferase
LNSHIRSATLADSERISNLIYVLAEKYITHELTPEGATTLLSSLRPNEIKQYIESGIKYHLAEIEDELVGVIAVKDNSHLYHLFVDEHYQRKGIASLLWSVAQEACLLKGNPGIFTVNSSSFALPIYEKLGFIVQEGQQEKDGVIYIPMKLKLQNKQ